MVAIKRALVRRKYPATIRLSELGPLVACDTETTGGNTWKGARPFGFSFCNPEGKTRWIQFPVDPFTREVEYHANPSEWTEIKDFMLNRKQAKIFHHAKFDVRMIETAGAPVRGKIHETMFAAHCCNSDEMSFKLKDLSLKYGGIPRDDQDDLQKATVRMRLRAKKAGWKIHEKVECDYWVTMEAWRRALIDPNEGIKIAKLCERYGVRDAERTMLLWLFYAEKMVELNVEEVYEREMELWPVVYAMEERGVHINPEETRRLVKAYDNDRLQNLASIQEYAKKAYRKGVLKTPEVNPNSSQQLAAMVYDYLKLEKEPNPYAKKDKSRSVDVDSMMELSAQHPLPDFILKHRAATRALQFLESYRTLMRKEGSYYLLHANFNQVGPKTGRFSCREPNMQQIPSKNTGRSPHPIDARAPFGPRPDHMWFNIDYSQLEVRIFADRAQEKTLLKLIKSGQHIHRGCADWVWGGKTEVAIKTAIKSLGFAQAGTADDDERLARTRKEYWHGSEWKTAEAWLKKFNWSIVAAEESIGRKNSVNKAKLAIFTRLFGGGIPSIMNLMKCTKQEAKEFLDEYASRFPDMMSWIEETARTARRERHVRTAYGRRIAVEPDFGYRGVNYIVQGSAADLMKRALVNCDWYLRDNNVKAWIVMTIHDEIVFEFHKSEDRQRHVLALKAIMEDHGGVFKIPMPTEVERVRKRWTDKEKVTWANAS